MFHMTLKKAALGTALRSGLRFGVVIAAVSVVLGGCEPMALGGKPQQSNPQSAPSARQTPGQTSPQTQTHNSHAASSGVGPQGTNRFFNRSLNDPLPRPPALPSLDELIGRIPQATTQSDGSAGAGEPPVIPFARGLRVAILLPLSGANQRVGSAMLNAAQMALFEFAGSDFELLVHDTQGTAEGSREAARLAIGDGARLIIGPLLSTSVRAVSDQAQAAGVPVVAFSSDRHWRVVVGSRS